MEADIRQGGVQSDLLLNGAEANRLDAPHRWENEARLGLVRHCIKHCPRQPVGRFAFLGGNYPRLKRAE